MLFLHLFAILVLLPSGDNAPVMYGRMLHQELFGGKGSLVEGTPPGFPRPLKLGPDGREHDRMVAEIGLKQDIEEAFPTLSMDPALRRKKKEELKPLLLRSLEEQVEPTQLAGVVLVNTATDTGPQEGVKYNDDDNDKDLKKGFPVRDSKYGSLVGVNHETAAKKKRSQAHIEMRKREIAKIRATERGERIPEYVHVVEKLPDGTMKKLYLKPANPGWQHTEF